LIYGTKGKMTEDTDPLILNSDIQTEDLTYSSPGERYFFKFSYLGNGIFLLQSRGYADEYSINKQIQCGDIARNRLAKIRPGSLFHLIWDISELKGASIFARYQMMLKAGKSGEYGSISAIGANNLAKSFAKILSILLPHQNFFFFRNTKEAYNQISANSQHKENRLIGNNLPPEVDSYSQFISLWQNRPEYFNINNTDYKSLHLDNWSYKSPENSFKSNYTVIDGNTLLCKSEGVVKAIHIEKTYQMLEDLISRLRFDNGTNKFYTIIDLKRVKAITLSARKLTAQYEEKYKDHAHLVIMIPSPILSFALRIQKLINPSPFLHWAVCSSLEEAFQIVQKHKNGDLSVQNLSLESNPIILDKNEIPKTREELAQYVEILHRELQELKGTQLKEIQRILEITGRMTWDESFSDKLEFVSENKSAFSDVFNALSIVHDDFQEIIKEKSLHVQKLKESEDKYRNLINLANDIIVVYQDMCLKLINSRVYNVLGYTIEEIQLVSPINFLAPNELGNVEKAFNNRIDDSPWYFETVLLHKNGSFVHVSVSVGRISFENRPADMLIIRDITSKHKAEAELDKYHNHLEELVAERTKQLEKEIVDREIAEKSDRLKSAFLSNMSHEIRTPMNAIIAFSDFLKDPELSAAQREEYVNYIQSSGRSLLTLINDIIDISKIEAKQINVQNISCSVNQSLEELFKLFQQHKKIKNQTKIELRLDKNDSDLNVTLHTDPYRLKQILSNLLDNALKFTENGVVNFGFNVNGKHIIFYVQDTGIGIPEDKTEFIFQRFGKIESINRNLGGTGLGLAISQNLATLLGGKLTLKSSSSEGSIFYLELPYDGEQQIPFTHMADNFTEKQSYIWAGKKILVAEDEELNFKVIEIGLQKTKATILRAKNGKEAIDILAINDIDIILMDIQMPVMNGYEALINIKQLHPSVPVIAQTAFALMEERERCLKYGFNDYISKPISISELLSKIDRYFN
jgi:PAS domain S-box-containing protein